ncbi:CoA transferase [Nocardia sp. CA2R105]|uniref:CoA transferase n=1 Tax=Nocardia coffeae TaxID=2873381 RepID=UPI001CA6A574|nr:CoA transferase [Nocardia coffeae]MBY8856176.1 CoA transferase [Nocardia coffeae]
MPPTNRTDDRPLAGLRIVEISSFVASPLCGLTLCQLGAQVIRIDPLGGAADIDRWPLTATGESIYWTGLNRGKRSLALDLRSDSGRDIVQRLITAPGDGGGILVTNAGGRDWLSHETLSALRSDVITLELLGRHDGRPAVDYTVNAALGFPQITGPLEHSGVVNHVLPAWDVAAGLHAALAVTAAVHRRALTGTGSRIVLPLEDVALATAGALGYLTEVQVNGSARPATGNAVYGTYGTDFVTADGERFMVVALTSRHFRDLMAVTGTEQLVAAVESALGADFARETDRFEHRDVLTALFARWFRTHDADHVGRELGASSVLHERYRSFEQVVRSGDLDTNPLFAQLAQPRIGEYLAAAAPASYDGVHLRTGPAARLGGDGPDVLREVLALGDPEISALEKAGVLAI